MKTEFFSRQILEQVRKDGRTYPELAKRMAEALLTKEEPVTSMQRVGLIVEDSNMLTEATKAAKEQGIPLYILRRVTYYVYDIIEVIKP